MKIAQYWTVEELMRCVFLNSPLDEPVRLSLNRLARAIIFDEKPNPEDPAPVYSPRTVWYAYARHPELSMSYEESKKIYNERKKLKTSR